MGALAGIISVAFVICTVEIICSRLHMRDAYALLRTLRTELRELSWADEIPRGRAIDMCDRINSVLPYDELVGGPR